MEREIQQKLEEKEESAVEMQETYVSLQQEVEVKTKKLKKVYSPVQDIFVKYSTTIGKKYEGCSKRIAYFYLETSNFKLAQKCSFHAIKELSVARNAKFQLMYPLPEGVPVR